METLISLSIIGIIAVIALPHITRARYKAALAACITNEKNIANSLEIQKNNMGRYPEDLTFLTEVRYMKVIPACPSNGLTYEDSYEVTDTGHKYTLSCPGIHNRLLKSIDPGYPIYSSEVGLRLQKFDDE